MHSLTHHLLTCDLLTERRWASHGCCSRRSGWTAAARRSSRRTSISPYLPISPHISPISPHISPNLRVGHDELLALGGGEVEAHLGRSRGDMGEIWGAAPIGHGKVEAHLRLGHRVRVEG